MKKAKQIGVGRGRGVIHCKNCGKPGHQRKTCPNGDTSHAIDAETGLQEKKIQLTPDKLNRIKKMLGEGVAQATIGDEVGVSEETVERIADSLGI